MAVKRWVQWELHVPSKKGKDLDKLQAAYIPWIAERVQVFYWNRYLSEGEHAFLKLGLKGVNKKKAAKLLKKAKDLGAKVKRGDPDLRRQGGMIVDDIKQLSTRAAYYTWEMRKPELSEFYLFVHFLANQLGLGYQEELQVYSALIHNIAQGGIKE